jgi:hypothetical protein
MKLTDKMRKAWPIRKGCMHCRGELKTTKEKILRTCNTCGSSAAAGFEMMAAGKFKKGFDKVIDTQFAKGEDEKAVVTEKIVLAVSKRKQKIIKKLRKQGLTEEEIEKGLGEYEKHMGR